MRAAVAFAAMFLVLVGCSSNGSGGAPVPASGPPSAHRALAAECPRERGPGTFGASSTSDAGTSPSFECRADSDCTAGTKGRCFKDPMLLGRPAVCDYDTCYSDADCTAGTVCLCRPDGKSIVSNRCLPKGNCHVDADCAGGFCSPSFALECGPNTGYAGYFCHTNQDECNNDSDCSGAGSRAYCAFDASRAKWVCDTRTCADDGA